MQHKMEKRLKSKLVLVAAGTGVRFGVGVGGTDNLGILIIKLGRPCPLQWLEQLFWVSMMLDGVALS